MGKLTVINHTKICTVPHCNYPTGECIGTCWNDSHEERIDIVAANGATAEHYTDAGYLLTVAAKHMRDRAATYDAPGGERSMGKAVAAFNAITGRDLAESEGWLLLQVLKDVRLFQRPGYHADSAEDCIAYAALKAESKAKGQNQ